MRAFVTGGTGFLGRRIVERLVARGDRVLALVRDAERGERLRSIGCETIDGDLSNVDGFGGKLRGCDVVFHAGARVVSTGDWVLFQQCNVSGTENLIDAARAAGVGRFVHVSSLGIFDIPCDGTTVTEESDYDHRPMMRGHYTRSKIDADRIAHAAARTGDPIVIVRPGVIFGHDHPSEPLYLGRVSRRVGSLLIVIGRPSYLVPVVYVENAADAVVLAGTVPGIEGHSFNVVDDPDLTQAAYFQRLKGLPTCPRHVAYLPVELFHPAAAGLDACYRRVGRRGWGVGYQLIRSGRSARYPNDAARATLGWEPRVPLEQALERTTRRGGE
jgi:nucleoside-diphosphate-sugar epimerase